MVFDSELYQFCVKIRHDAEDTKRRFSRIFSFVFGSICVYLRYKVNVNLRAIPP